MITKETQTKLQENLANPSFSEYLYNCLDVETATAYFKEHGLELTEDEVITILNDIKSDKATFGNLSDSALDDVAGGGFKKCREWDKMGMCIDWRE